MTRCGKYDPREPLWYSMQYFGFPSYFGILIGSCPLSSPFQHRVDISYFQDPSHTLYERNTTDILQSLFFNHTFYIGLFAFVEFNKTKGVVTCWSQKIHFKLRLLVYDDSTPFPLSSTHLHIL